MSNTTGSFIANAVSDLAENLGKTHILDEISIYGLADYDGSSTFSFEWIGADVPREFHEEILDFLMRIKELVIDSKKEVKEQEEPHSTMFDGLVRIIYRFRIWSRDGQYECVQRRMAG